jgi:hypothetical protein
MSFNWQTGHVVVEQRMVSGTIVVVAYQAEFARASATEEFTWRITDGRAILVAYNVERN